jgi:hypothetical protein
MFCDRNQLRFFFRRQVDMYELNARSDWGGVKLSDVRLGAAGHSP